MKRSGNPARGVKRDCTFVIMGASGDLARKKLIPAIFRLASRGALGNFIVVGVSRSPHDGAELVDGSGLDLKGRGRAVLRRLRSRTFFYRMDFMEDGYCALGDHVTALERRFGLSGNRVFYLATLPKYFAAIVEGLGKCGLAAQKGNFVRVAFEKPFGDGAHSAREINRRISGLFGEDQVYRVDHYLGKEIVKNISMARFGNTFLEPVWNRKHIEQVQIIISEDCGVGERGSFYDRYGAIGDVFQNHLLQLASLVAMERPRTFDAEQVAAVKAKALKKMAVRRSVLGQYEGYMDDIGVAGRTGTETFAAVELEIRNDRWRGVPFFLMTGKRLPGRYSLIHMRFKRPECDMIGCLPANHLMIRIQPDEGFYIRMNAVSPDGKPSAVNLAFCHACTFGPNSPEAYENILKDVISGDRKGFVSSREIEEQWRIAGSVKKGRLIRYKRGSLPDAGFVEWER